MNVLYMKTKCLSCLMHSLHYSISTLKTILFIIIFGQNSVH